MRRGGRGAATLAFAGTVAALATGAGGCRNQGMNDPTDRFTADLAFLERHSPIVVLADPQGTARVAVAPAYQGRVITSTTGGADAPSFGWIGRVAIEARGRQPHMNVFGGEDRLPSLKNC